MTIKFTFDLEVRFISIKGVQERACSQVSMYSVFVVWCLFQPDASCMVAVVIDASQ